MIQHVDRIDAAPTQDQRKAALACGTFGSCEWLLYQGWQETENDPVPDFRVAVHGGPTEGDVAACVQEAREFLRRREEPTISTDTGDEE